MSLLPLHWQYTLETWTQISSDDRIEFTKELDNLSTLFAKDVDKRVVFGNENENWNFVKRAWTIAKDVNNEASMQLILPLAKLTRNLVPQVPSNQEKAFQIEPVFASCIFHLTSFSFLSNEKAWPSLRMLVQLLSNMITSNKLIAAQFLDKYITKSCDRNLLLRILESPDLSTSQSCFILLLNALCLVPQYASNLFNSVGHRILVALLDKLENLSEYPENTQTHQAFETGYKLFLRIFESVELELLWKSIEIENAPITPTRVVFLKILDAYIQSDEIQSCNGLNQFTFLGPELNRLCRYTVQSITQSLGTTASNGNHETPLQGLDSHLPRVCQAQILVSQCLIGLLLLEQSSTGVNQRTCVIGAQLKKKVPRFIEDLLSCLRQLDLFLPRIMYGKVASLGPLGTHHPDPTGFTNLKSDLVRLLGILVYEDLEVQDRIRLCEGIPVVMNFCVVDERNPLLREYALFTLRNLLQGNVENQKVVDAIQPSGYWDKNGVLKEIPGATRK